MPATDHGSAFPNPEGRCAREGAAPTGVPHRWQNFAPGVSRARHATHDAPRSGAPQFAQNFPLDSAPQEEQVVGRDEGDGDGAVGGAIGGNLARRCAHRSAYCEC